LEAMSTKAGELMMAAQRRVPVGAERVFANTDVQAKEAAVRMRLGVRGPEYRPAPRKVVTPSMYSTYRRPPAPPTKPASSKVLDRCIIAWPDPNAADVRPYMGASAGSYNDRTTWSLPYKPTRGYSFPPQTTRSIFA